ncbi:MAG: DNA polymerase III subunit delta, partial [Spirochaetaceae bacterium]|nr:DNA polymerase III subunit delta [Spirochaetaceae bacterium]
MSASPLWLYTGPEFGERSQAVEQLRRDAEKKSGPLDVHSLYAHDVRVEDVIALLQNGSLFAEERFVVLKNAELIKKKEDIQCITDWAGESAGKTGSLLLLVSDEIGIDKKLEAAVPKEQKRIFWELFEDRKEQWLRDFFRKAGFRINDDGVEAILELVENNTEALRSECSRFLLFFTPDHVITAEDVDRILAHNREESAFTLFDRLADGSFEDSLEVLQRIRLSKESSGVQLIAGLTFCFRRLLLWHRIHREGRPSDFDLKIKGFSSEKAKDQYRRAQRRWSASDTSRILALLAGMD